MFDVNVFGVIDCIQQALPHLRDRRGNVVITASKVGIVAQTQTPIYNASKGAVIALTKSLAIDYASEGIRVNCVCPGIIDTKLFRDYIDGLPDPAAALAEHEVAQPLGRLGTPEDCAKAALFLASDDAGFVTGVPLLVDGGTQLNESHRAAGSRRAGRGDVPAGTHRIGGRCRGGLVWNLRHGSTHVPRSVRRGQSAAGTGSRVRRPGGVRPHRPARRGHRGRGGHQCQCGRCSVCRGAVHDVRQLPQVGVHRNGAFAPLVGVPPPRCAPAGRDARRGGMSEPLACVVHAQSKLRWTPGATVAVFGAGPIGVLHGQLALARGAARVLMVDISRARLDAVADLEGMVPVDATNDGVGAIRWLTDGRGADIVIETAAVPASYEAAQRAVLRTPIAALRTFNELLTDGQVPDKATRQEFLEQSAPADRAPRLAGHEPAGAVQARFGPGAARPAPGRPARGRSRTRSSRRSPRPSARA